MKYLLVILLSLLTLLISLPLKSEELSLPIKKGQAAQFDGVLVPGWQAKEMLDYKYKLDSCLTYRDSVCPVKPGDDPDIPEVLYFFGAGLGIGLIGGLLLR